MAPSAPDARWLLDRIDRVPMKLFVVAVIACLSIEEWYPLSHFPMYSSLGPTASFAYITTAEGEVLPMEREFGIRAAALKKARVSYARKAGRRVTDAAVCRATLRHALEHRARAYPERPPLENLRLRVVSVERVGRAIETKDRSCGTDPNSRTEESEDRP